MDRIKVCFIGIGSIAKRHIRNLHLLCRSRGLELHIDAFRQKGGEVDGVERVYIDAEICPAIMTSSLLRIQRICIFIHFANSITRGNISS